MGTTAGRRGSVRRDGDRGTFYLVADVSVPGGPRKQVRRRGFPTSKAAQAELTRLLGEVDTGRYVPRDPTVTLRSYALDVWLPALRTRGRRPSTMESYERNLRVHVLPRLGDRPLCDVTAEDLDRLYADLLAGGSTRGALAPRTVRYVHTILHGLFRHAVVKARLPANPCERADAPEQRACRSRSMETWTSEQLRRFLESLPDDPFRPALFLLATTGMRRGEALGLQWSDIDLARAELRVRRTLGAVDDGLVVTEPKTKAGTRPVALDGATVAVLRAHRQAQREERLAAGPAWHDEGWVFTMPDGRPMHPNRFRRAFLRRVAGAKVPRIRLHDLRHTWATLALQAGINPKIVQERLGHASVAITLDIYTHVDTAQHRAAAEAVTSQFLPRASGHHGPHGHSSPRALKAN